jgi:hypothetical protein
MMGSRSIIGTAIAIGLLTGSAVGVMAQEDAAVSPPREFTGHIVCGPEVRTGTLESVAAADDSGSALSRTRGYAWETSATMSDPRLEGTYYISYDTDEYRGPGGTTTIGSGTWRIENEEGAWQGSYLHADDPDYATTVWMPLVGEGDFDGLTALWESVYNPSGLCSWDVRGVIIDGDPPAAPEPYASE